MAEHKREPAWLTAKADQRLALMASGHTPVQISKVTASIIMLFLSEPPPDSTPADYATWERSCDNCGRFCPGTFYTGVVKRELHGMEVVITYGVCPDCKDLP